MSHFSEGLSSGELAAHGLEVVPPWGTCDCNGVLENLFIDSFVLPTNNLDIASHLTTL